MHVEVSSAVFSNSVSSFGDRIDSKNELEVHIMQTQDREPKSEFPKISLRLSKIGYEGLYTNP